MTESNEQAAARDAAHWAKSVSELSVSEVPEGATGINVAGKRLTSPIQGFGKMWQKTYRMRLPADVAPAADVIAKPETNVVLAGPDQADAATTLLDVLGMVRLCRVDKARESFRHPGHADVVVVIDHITGLGAFAETEVMATDPAAAAALLEQIETQLGLMECTEIYARPTTCRSSTYGAEKRPRVWVVKTGSEWKHCSYPDLSKGCVGIRSLPSPVVQ